MSVRVEKHHCINVPEPMFSCHHHIININTGEEICDLPPSMRHPIESWSTFMHIHAFIVGFLISPLPFLIVFAWFAIRSFWR